MEIFLELCCWLFMSAFSSLVPLEGHSAPHFWEKNLKLIQGWRTFSPEHAALYRIFINIKPKNAHSKYSIHMRNYLVESAHEFTAQGSY